jgi:hypothetical protein
MTLDKNNYLNLWKEQMCLNQMDKHMLDCALNCRDCPYGCETT